MIPRDRPSPSTRLVDVARVGGRTAHSFLNREASAFKAEVRTDIHVRLDDAWLAAVPTVFASNADCANGAGRCLGELRLSIKGRILINFVAAEKTSPTVVKIRL